MPITPEEAPRPVAALLIFGNDIDSETLRMVGLQVELFLEELDRSLAGNDSSRFEWRVVDPTFRGRRVMVGAVPREEGQGVYAAMTVLDQARWGIAALGRSARCPPAFTPTSLGHLRQVVEILTMPAVSHLVFYAEETSEVITPRTLKNLESLARD